MTPLTPHGPGFSFLDAFEADAGRRTGRGRKWLDPALPFFADHFPGEPLMPAVLLIECAAQAAGALWAAGRGDAAPARFALAQIGEFKVHRPMRPGDTVHTEVTLERSFGRLALFAVTLRGGDGAETARGRLVLAEAASDPI